MKDIVIEAYYDGWTIKVDDKCFRYNIKDMGSANIKRLLEHLGYNVEIEDLS